MNLGEKKMLTQAERSVAGHRMQQRGETGESVSEISRETGISRKHLYDLEKKYANNPLMADLERTGRPPKVTEQMRRRIILAIEKNPFAPATTLTAEVNDGLPAESHISVRTFRSVAISRGLRARRPAFKPSLTKAQAERRLEFAQNYVNKDMRYWSHIIFTDETQVLTNPTDRRERVRRPRHKRYDQRFIKKTQRFSNDNSMFWGAIHYNGTGSLIAIEGTVNADIYLEILKRGIPLTVRKLNLSSFTFQDDNAPCHRAKKVERYKEQQGIRSLPWPANSPDLNPIEDIWALWKDRIKRRSPQTREQLRLVALREWNNITLEEIRVRIRSLPRRLLAIIKAKGWNTKY